MGIEPGAIASTLHLSHTSSPFDFQIVLTLPNLASNQDPPASAS
jgi:hypothetical protein